MSVSMWAPWSRPSRSGRVIVFDLGDRGGSFEDVVGGADVASGSGGEFGWCGGGEFVKTASGGDLESVEHGPPALQVGEERDGRVLVGSSEVPVAQLTDDLIGRSEVHAYKCTKGV